MKTTKYRIIKWRNQWVVHYPGSPYTTFCISWLQACSIVRKHIEYKAWMDRPTGSATVAKPSCQSLTNSDSAHT